MHGHHSNGVGLLVIPVDVGKQGDFLQKLRQRAVFMGGFKLRNIGFQLHNIVNAALRLLGVLMLQGL